LMENVMLCMTLGSVMGRVELVLPGDNGKGMAFAASVLGEALEETGHEVRTVGDNREGRRGEDLSSEGKKIEVIVGAKNARMPDNAIPEDLKEDGFVLLSKKGRLLVGGLSERADAYALCYLAERVRLDSNAWKKPQIRREPHFSIRMASGCSKEEALRMGYNVWSGVPGPTRVVTFLGWMDGLLHGDDFDRQRENGENLLKIEKEASDLGLCVVGGGDEFQFPSQVLERDDILDLTELGDDREFCVASEATWEMYRAKYREYVRRFPCVDFCILRLGENYSHLTGGAYVGNGVYHFGVRKPYCQRCKDLSYDERIAKVINETAAILCPSPIQYIHRTWDTRQDLIHGNDEVYQKILARVDQREKILWSIKYTKTDFWRYNFPNPCIGVGGVKQMVEFQCQREYEGKGAYPNYIGRGVAEGHRYAADKRCVGVWHWHHGGGWGGPKVVDDMWNQANIYACAHLAWDPEANPKELAREWAVLTFGKKASHDVVDLMMLSEDAVLKSRYFEAYSKNHFGWMPANNWMRDDKIRGEERLMPIYEGAKELVDSMIEEKEEALRLVEKMREIARGTEGKMDAVLHEHLTTSLEYEYWLTKTCLHYTAAYFLFRRWQEKQEPEHQERAREHLEQWRESWTRYRNDVPKLPGCATLYNDDGMEATMEKVSTSF